MKKSFSVTGKNGTFNGEVVVILNAEIRTRTMRNWSTHEDEIVKYPVHKVLGKAAGKDLPVMETEQEEKVPELVAAVENQVVHLLNWASTREVTQTVHTILKDRGYN